MKLLMLNNEFPPLGGGTATVTLEILKEFSKVAHLHVLLITAGENRQVEQIDFAERISIVRLPVQPRDRHHQTIWDLGRYARMALGRAMRDHRNNNFDICWAWGTLPAGVVAAALRARFRVPYIVRVMGPDIPGFESRYRYLYPVIRPLIASVWKRADAVVAKCAGEVDMMLAALPGLAIEVISNGVDAATFRPDNSRSKGDPRILCVGRLIQRKGQHDLVQALKNLQMQNVSATLTLVGEGDDEARLRAAVQGQNLSDRVTFAGYVPREEMPKYYNAADVFVLPSYNEGMSVSVLEALASGLPVISSMTGGSEELIEQGVQGFTFPAGDISKLSDLLLTLCKDTSQREAMGVAARAQAERFSWASASNKFEKLITRVLKDSN